MTPDAGLKSVASWVRDKARRSSRWRGSSLNLIASESVTSPLVQEVLACDFSRRYTSGGVYAGSRYLDEVIERCRCLARRLFGCRHVELRPMTGNQAVLTWLFGLTQPGDRVVTTDPAVGGYPLRAAQRLGLEVHYFPFDFARMQVRLPESVELIGRVRPSLVILGASEILFPYPQALIAAAHEAEATVVYDGSHVMGLIAGGRFQDPFADGVDILGGSTHKTFCGPQGGIVLVSDDGDLYRRIAATLDPPPMLASCVHVARIAALTVAIGEMLAFGRELARRIVANARSLAGALAREGFELFAATDGYTRSHQVLLRNGDDSGFCSPRGRWIKDRLEACNILVDAVVRLGVTEVTRLGMREPEMAAIARLMRRALLDGEPPESVRRDVKGLARSFRALDYTFSPDHDPYAYREYPSAKAPVCSSPRMSVRDRAIAPEDDPIDRAP